MPEPITITSRRVDGTDAEIISSFYPVPGLGLVPINAFVLHAAQPVLVDTGFVAMGDAYLRAIERAINLDDLRWIWLTHVDADHIGCLFDVLDRAPRATVVTTFLGLGKLGLVGTIAPQRAHLLNPGQRLDIGDRSLVAFKPPLFDAPETTGFFDTKTSTLFSSDCFGTLVSTPVERANDLTPAALHEGVVTWATIDAPWLPSLDVSAYERSLGRVRELGPRFILSSHAAPAFEMTQVLLDQLVIARTAPPFIGPDQEALTRMLGAAE
jgi:glyoxylase-like metal-dependent hydrolase (beta-lactamase superfamily II)